MIIFIAAFAPWTAAKSKIDHQVHKPPEASRKDRSSKKRHIISISLVYSFNIGAKGPDMTPAEAAQIMQQRLDKPSKLTAPQGPNIGYVPGARDSESTHFHTQTFLQPQSQADLNL